MKLSEKLLIVADWLEHSENDLLVNAEFDGECLSIVANALVKAADALKEGAEVVSKVEPGLHPHQLDEMAAVAEAFDASDDDLLKKQASVLDEILLTLASPKGSSSYYKTLEDNRIEALKKKYNDIKPQHDEMNKISDAVKDIENSSVYKAYRPLSAPLSSRCCPDHAGAQMARVGEGIFQCLMDKKVYNYAAGYTTLNGNKVPGGSVDAQTSKYTEPGHEVFDTRESRLGLDNK